MRTRTLVGGLLSLLLAAGQAYGQDEYEFDTGSGEIKLNDNRTFFFNGVFVADLGASGGIRTWAVLGDMNVTSTISVTFKGSNLARVLVGRNLIIAGGSISADAMSDMGGPGGGMGGAGGSGGGGGAGGIGGGGVNGVDGLPGQPGIGSAGGLGGPTPRMGGQGGNGNEAFGMSGGTGLGRGIGANGQMGESAEDGGAPTLGVNNFAGLPPLPAPRSGGIGGPGGSLPGGGGFGGDAGGGAGPGGLGGAGNIGSTGGHGRFGSNGNGYFPGPPAVPTLNAGNGGSGGSGGGGGGGGGGGTTGAGGGGGGGGGGDPVKGCSGGGGGGGGAGGSGGEGGVGGTGGEGGKGGGGGGGVQFIVQGRVDHNGGISARGADSGAGMDGTNGETGRVGGIGGPGGAGAGPSCPQAVGGGPGGPGGDGGIGGPGGLGGNGEDGGAGSGGVVFIAGTILAGDGSIDIGGGVGPSFAAPAGRVLYGDAAVGSPTYTHVVNPGLTSRTLDYVPAALSPYFPSFASPNIAAASAGGADLDAGPGPFGLLPASLSDATIESVASSAPPNATAVLIRFDSGPSGFDAGLNLANVSSSTEQFDLYVLVSLSDLTTPALFNGVSIAQFPFTRRAEYGGPGEREAILLPARRAWAVLGPESGAASIMVAVTDVNVTLTMADPAEGGWSAMYLVPPPCGADFNDDGVVNSADFFEFLTVFFVLDPAADVNGDGAVNSQDFFDFLAALFAGC